MKQHLDGLQVMVTRPRPSGEMLCHEIEVAGGQPVYFPTIDIVPPGHPDMLEQQIAKLDKQDWLIFISPQAVYTSKKILSAVWPIFPASVKIAAVGLGTAKALQAAGLPVDCYPKECWSSEGLLALPEFQHVQGKKIAIMQGEGGRDWLGASLKMRGARVSSFVAYRRVMPIVDVEPVNALLRAQKIDAIVCTSGEGLRNLKELLKNVWSNLQKIPIIVISDRMVDLAKKLDFQKIVLAENAGSHAIMETLSSNKDYV